MQARKSVDRTTPHYTALHYTATFWCFVLLASPHLGLDLEYTGSSETDEINEIEWIETR